VVAGLFNLISTHREPDTEILRFPPVMSRQQLEKSGYLRSFPHLLGCVSALHGGEADIRSAVGEFESGGNWAAALAPTDLVLTPAACYPVYPFVASRALRASRLLFDVACECFRHEPSRNIDRMQSFRIREYVCIGEAGEIEDFRAGWMVRAGHIAERLGLPHRIEQASDPFFDRGGR
jgi:seryl-tRNA synthetase